MNELVSLCQRAKEASFCLNSLSTQKKNEALIAVSNELEMQSEYILKENQKDYLAAKESGMSEGLLDRLKLTEERIKAMAVGLIQITELNDPIGEVLAENHLENGLQIKKVRVPFGVVGIIYESRPNVTADAFGLCFKSGNAVILKGGSDALCSNMAIEKVIRDGLKKSHVTQDAICLISSKDRSVTNEFMKMKEYVDVLIPRGGAGLIRSVVENASIPVIETGTGNCHIYIDKDADLSKAIPIVINAKTQRIGVCNACESLVVHESIRKEFFEALLKEEKMNKVVMHADEKSISFIQNAFPATEEDFRKEYLDYALSVKTVSNLKEAISHINQYNTKHSECIVTENREAAEEFLNEVDAACVYVNASTRFTDGFEFGFGAEIGISTQKLHARGPMGLEQLTSYKYKIYGNGQVRG